MRSIPGVELGLLDRALLKGAYLDGLLPDVDIVVLTQVDDSILRWKKIFQTRPSLTCLAWEHFNLPGMIVFFEGEWAFLPKGSNAIKNFVYN